MINCPYDNILIFIFFKLLPLETVKNQIMSKPTATIKATFLINMSLTMKIFRCRTLYSSCTGIFSVFSNTKHYCNTLLWLAVVL